MVDVAFQKLLAQSVPGNDWRSAKQKKIPLKSKCKKQIGVAFQNAFRLNLAAFCCFEFGFLNATDATVKCNMH